MKKSSLKRLVGLGTFGVLGLSACGEKNDQAQAPAGGSGAKAVAAKAAAVETTAAVAPAADLAAVAQATGFAKYLPATTQAYAGVFDGKVFLDGLQGSALVKLFEEQVRDNGDPSFSLEELGEAPEAQMAVSLLGEEIFLAVGEGTDLQTANLVSINESVTRHWAQTLVKMGEAGLAGEDALAVEEIMLPLVVKLLGDAKAGVGALEKAQMPPVTLGFKVSDEDIRGQLLEMVSQGIGAILEDIGPDGEGFAEALNIERGGSNFTGLKVVGEKLVASLPPDVKEGLSQVMDAATVDKLIGVLESRDLVIAVGVHENYLIGFTGSSADELQIADSPSDSILSRPEAAFMNSYADKKLLGLMTVSKELQDSITKEASLLGSFAEGIREGLSETEAFGDTQEIETLLELIVEQERGIFSMQGYTPAGLVAFLEDGLKIEGHGGSTMPELDLDTPRSYASLATGEGVFLFANQVANGEYRGKVFEYLDTLGQTVYLGAKKAARMEIPDAPGDLDEFQETFGIFDERILPHFLELWTGLRGDLVSGLGNEGAILVDLGGELPTVPGLPQLVVDEGKAPRLALLAPAKDKEKLKSSWVNIDKALNGILKMMSEMTGENIPMQKPMSSEKNELKTWFFPFPFQSDDFVLNVSVDEKNVYASTSKSFVQALSGRMEEGEVDPAAKGAYFKVDFTALNNYVNGWLKLLEDNKDQVFGEDSPAAEDFLEGLPVARQVLAAFGELKGISGHIRKEDGVVRSSIHVMAGN